MRATFAPLRMVECFVSWCWLALEHVGQVRLGILLFKKIMGHHRFVFIVQLFTAPCSFRLVATYSCRTTNTSNRIGDGGRGFKKLVRDASFLLLGESPRPLGDGHFI